MMVGDTHGNAEVIAFKAKLAYLYKIKKMVVLGDFGMWPGRGGVAFLDDVNCALKQYGVKQYGIKLYALPGNHEDHDQWEWWVNSKMPTDENGFTFIRSHILIAPKVKFWRWGDKQFAIAGGAVSIDRGWRTPGKSWWPNEELSVKNLESIHKYSGPQVDYLFSHDCSNYTPWGFKLNPDMNSQIHRQKMDEILESLSPRMHFHGHMHKKYEWVNEHTGGTLTYGLDCDGEDASWGILDTDDDKFYWPNQTGKRYFE